MCVCVCVCVCARVCVQQFSFTNADTEIFKVCILLFASGGVEQVYN